MLERSSLPQILFRDTSLEICIGRAESISASEPLSLEISQLILRGLSPNPCAYLLV